MQDRPTAVELIGAVQHFLEHEVLPALDDHRLRFRTLVAANALAILQRELSAGATLAQEEMQRLQQLLDTNPTFADNPEQQRSTATAGTATPAGRDQEEHVNTLRLELARRIRAGDADHGPWRQTVIASTLASVRAKLSISNPKLVEHDQHQQA